MKRRIFAVILLVGILAALIQPSIASAADYLFEVPRAQCQFLHQQRWHSYHRILL